MGNAKTRRSGYRKKSVRKRMRTMRAGIRKHQRTETHNDSMELVEISPSPVEKSLYTEQHVEIKLKQENEALKNDLQADEQPSTSRVQYPLLKQENEVFKNILQGDEQPSTSEDPLAENSTHIEVKLEEDSDIDIEDHKIQEFSNSYEFENKSYTIDNINQFKSEIDTQEATTTRLYNSVENCESSTSISRNPNIRVSERVVKQSIQNRWKSIVKKVPKTYAKQATHTMREKSNVTELCVLCAKDLSKVPYKKSVSNFLEMIINVTGVDVTQYPSFPSCCPTCYSNLISIKNFQKKVHEANILIWNKLTELSALENTEFESVDTDHNETEPFTIADDNDHTVIKMESEDTEEMNVTETENVNSTSSNPIVETVSDRMTENTTLDVTQSNIEEESKSKNTSKKKYISGDSRRACSVCGKLYSKRNYEKHVQTHENVIVACKICKKQLCFGSMREHLQKHEELRKKPKDKFICAQCGGSYSTYSRLRSHEITHGEKKHVCCICGSSFHFHNYLARHMRSHSGEKPFACSNCDKTFSILWNLHQHQRLHTNSKPYKCKICSAAFRHNVTLKGHLATAHTANEIAASQKETAESQNGHISEGNQKNSNITDNSCDNVITETVATNS